MALMRRADRVVAMGGYNTVYEALALEKHTLIVPRTTPRREQIIRAERLHGLGLVDMCSPERLTPRALSHWLAEPHSLRPSARTSLRFDGLDRVEALVAELAGGRPAFLQEAATA